MIRNTSTHRKATFIQYDTTKLLPLPKVVAKISPKVPLRDILHEQLDYLIDHVEEVEVGHKCVECSKFKRISKDLMKVWID